MRRTRFLRRGDRIAVVATGFAVRAAVLRRGIETLRGMGFAVDPGPHVLERDGYLAGTDDRRAADLIAALSSPEVRAVWFARGGYGTARLLDRIPWSSLRRDPKPLIGYSDLTALFNPVVTRTRSPCLYGPVVAELGQPGAWDARSLRATLAGRAFGLRLRARQILSAGRASGRLVGGNLSVLSHLLGTRFEPDFRGAVLLLEEIGEPTYRVDRMLTQLRLSGALGRVSGVLLGGLAVPPRRRFPPDRDLDTVLAEALLPLGVPVVGGLPVGHVARKVTLPLGARVTIDTASRTLRFVP